MACNVRSTTRVSRCLKNRKLACNTTILKLVFVKSSMTKTFSSGKWLHSQGLDFFAWGFLQIASFISTVVVSVFCPFMAFKRRASGSTPTQPLAQFLSWTLIFPVVPTVGREICYCSTRFPPFGLCRGTPWVSAQGNRRRKKVLLLRVSDAVVSASVRVSRCHVCEYGCQ